MNEQALAIGVDIGGTKIAFALVDHTGKVVYRHRIPTAQHEGRDPVIQRIVAGIHHLEAQIDPDTQILGVGIGNPGLVDPDNGLVISAVHLGWYNEPIHQLIYEALDCKHPVYIENDVRALAMGEHTFGVAQGHDNFVYIALGTGLGDAAMVDGRLVKGAHFAAMELGHMATIPNGRKCICGRYGCLDMYLSGVGLIEAVKEYRHQHPNSPLAQLDSPTSQDVIHYMQLGNDPLAETIRQEVLHWMKQVLMWVGGVLDTGLFVIGGGTGHAILPFIHAELQTHLGEHVVSKQIPPIKASTMDDSAVGASSLIWHSHR